MEMLSFFLSGVLYLFAIFYTPFVVFGLVCVTGFALLEILRSIFSREDKIIHLLLATVACVGIAVLFSALLLINSQLHLYR